MGCLLAWQAKQSALKRHTSKLIMGPGQEADDVKAIQVLRMNAYRCAGPRVRLPATKCCGRCRPHGSPSRTARTKASWKSSPSSTPTLRRLLWRRPSRTWTLSALRCPTLCIVTRCRHACADVRADVRLRRDEKAYTKLAEIRLLGLAHFRTCAHAVYMQCVAHTVYLSM